MQRRCKWLLPLGMDTGTHTDQNCLLLQFGNSPEKAARLLIATGVGASQLQCLVGAFAQVGETAAICSVWGGVKPKASDVLPQCNTDLVYIHDLGFAQG